MNALRITPYKTFRVKKIKVIINDRDLLLVNVLGFGFWVLKSKNAKDAWKKEEARI